MARLKCMRIVDFPYSKSNEHMLTWPCNFQRTNIVFCYVSSVNTCCSLHTVCVKVEKTHPIININIYCWCTLTITRTFATNGLSQRPKIRCENSCTYVIKWYDIVIHYKKCSCISVMLWHMFFTLFISCNCIITSKWVNVDPNKQHRLKLVKLL